MATRAEMITQIRNTAPELLAGVDVNALEDNYITSMLQDAKRLAFMKKEAAPVSSFGGDQQYLFRNPAEYFDAFGTIPVNFTGTSGYYDTKDKSMDIRYLSPDENASYALVSPKSGQVLGSGAGTQGLLSLATQANQLNAELGREADWQLQKVGPGGQNEVIGTNKYNSDRTLLGKIFEPILDVGLPILASALVPGAGLLGTVLPAAAGSAVASAANNRSLKDALLRAAITGATAGIGEKLFTPVQKATETAAQTVAQTAGQTAGQTVAQKAAQEAAQKFGEEIIVNATRNAVPSLLGSVGGGLASSFVPSFFDSAQVSDIMPPEPQAATTDATDQIVVTGTRPTNLLPAALMTPAAVAAAAAANATGATTSAADLAASRTSMTPEQMAAVNAGAGGTGLLANLTKNLGLTDYLTLGSLAGSALGSLAGGGLGSGTGAPYVSPFGAGPAFGAGTDMRVNPNIQDYERYGFGPEATFFAPQYNQLVSSASGTTSNAMPNYRPLLNG